MIRKLIAASLLPFALVGCGGEEQPDPNANYLEGIREFEPSLSVISDERLIEKGEGVCDAFEGGATFNEIAMTFLAEDFTPVQTGAIVGGAINFKCPEFETMVDSTY